MPNHVDPICSTLDFTRKQTTFRGVSELLRRISYKVASAFGYSSEFLGLTESNHLAAMASAIPIDISSSDSDLDLQEIDNYQDESPLRDTSSSANVRYLPQWATSSHPNIPGNNGLSRRDPSFSSSKRHIVHDEISPRPHKRSRIPENVGASSSRARHNFSGQTNGSNNVDRMDASHGIQSSSLPMKRSLPAYLQPSSSGLHSNNLVENVGTSKFREIQGRSFTSLNHPSMHENRGNRLLPPSIVNGKYPSTSAFGGSNDALNHTGVGEERPPEADERYVFQAAVQDLHQPKVETDLPNGLLSVSLLRHQKIALTWMLGKESSGLCLGGILADDQGLGKTVSMIALMLMQKSLEKRKRKESCSSTTEPLNLDDDGESVVALDETNQIKESADLAVLPQASSVRPKRPTAGTLIVCPASVVRQWSRELDEKVADGGRLSVLIYHGGQRTKNPSVLAKYDAVLTTYAIVANEVPKQPLVDEGDAEQKDGERYGISAAFTMEKKKKKSSKKSKKGKDVIDLSAIDSSSGTLAKVNWSRVILDESQTIKNHRTQVARACCSLRAKRRWCLSGTPIQNSIDELFSYFRFLRYDPYDKFKVFGASIKALISRDSVKGYKKLQVVLRNIMLRRTKGTLIEGQPIINLPPKRVDLTKVDFSIEERNFYNQLEADSRKQFKAYAAAGTVNQNYANILLMLLRLRQACDHPLLIKGLTSNPVGKVSTDMAKMLPRELLVNLLKQLETSLAICLVCRDPPENAVVTMCGHVFCYQCVSDNLTGEDNTCPASECKEHLGADVVFSRSTLRRCLSDDNDSDSPITYDPASDNSMVLKTEYISSKIKSALDILNTHCVWRRQISEFYDEDNDERRGPEKAIVFSQWTSMLDLVEMSFKNNCINYRRLDGTMSIAARDKGVKEFNTDPEVDVMLMSLKAGNLGLNMVAASRVILLDLWWNPTTEDQAIDRAHRIGQTRPVTVSRLTIKDTVEDRILSLQEDKRKMVASAFGEDQSGGRGSRLTVDDLRFLFEGSNSSRR